MKTRVISFFIISLAILYSQSIAQNKPSKPQLVAPNAEITKLAAGFKFTEGPASDFEGNIYFTDIPNNRIHIWSTEDKLTTYLDNSGGANGLYFDLEGNLLACAGSNGNLVSIDKDKKISILASQYESKPFNSPNDLWIDPNGGVYFTDPRYGDRSNLPQDGEHVYYLPPKSKNAIRVINDMIRPNGLIGTPDGKMLYVADHGSNKTFSYKIEPDGCLLEKTLFVEKGSDGMTIDHNGNIYITTETVEVYDPSGILIESIEVPERPSNVTFGGKDQKTLFITARTSFYSLKMTVKAAKFSKKEELKKTD